MGADSVLPFAPAAEAGFGPGTRLRCLDLTAANLPKRWFDGVSARFGAIVAVQTDGGLHVPVADVPDERPSRLRIVRRPAAEAISPPEVQHVEPLPRLVPQEASIRPPMSGRAFRQGLDRDRLSERRSGFWLAVVLMVATWAGLVAVGAQFFNTPRNGFKVEWR